MSTATKTTSVLQSALQTVSDSPEFRRVLDQIKRGARVVSVGGLVAAPARALALAALQHETGKQFVVVVPAQRDLENWERDISFWYCALRGVTDCEDAVAVLPASESDPYAGGSPHAETLEKRALALWRLARRLQGGTGVPPVKSHAQDARGTEFLLLTSRALARRTVAPEEILKAGAVLKRDEDASPEELVDKLTAGGYVREDPIGAVGEFSMRGGILDVWPPGRSAPARIEFFGDTVESIREFDPETQLSTTRHSSQPRSWLRSKSRRCGNSRSGPPTFASGPRGRASVGATNALPVRCATGPYLLKNVKAFPAGSG